MHKILIAGGLFISIFLGGCEQKQSITPEKTKKTGEADGYENALYQEFRKTRDPNLDIIPNERLITAKAYMESLMAHGVSRIQSLTWEERGPNNIGGRCRALVIDKRDATGNTVIAGSVGGGIFRTTNFNTGLPNWASVNDLLPNLAVTAIIQDAAHPDTLFAGTGEGWGNIDAIRGGGIYKSTNGGVSWTLISSTSGFEYVQDLAIDNNGNLYASLRNLTSTFRGVLRSTDRGSNWSQVLGAPLPGFATGRAADLEVAANGDIYASLGIFSRTVILKSAATNGSNTGALNTWTDITPPSGSGIFQRAELIVAPSNANRVYVLLQDSATSQVLNMYRSDNAGTNWIPIAVPSALNNGTNSQCWYNLIGACDPANADILVVGGFNLARSTDAGANWTQITTSSTVHVDQHMILYNGSANLINGNDGGIYFTTNANTAAPNFTAKNNGFNVTQFYGGDLHPVITNYLLAGAQDNFSQKFTSAGINSSVVVTGGDGGIAHIDQTDGNLQITSNTSNNYYRSTNGGASFSSLSVNNTRGQFINPTDLNDAQKTLYCGDDAGKYFAISGLTGTPAGLQVTVAAMGTSEVTAVKVDPVAPNTIWLGCSYGTPAVAPLVMKLSSASTSTPVVVTSAIIPVAAGASISSIDVDASNANNVLVTLSSYGITSVYLSINGGVSFSSIEGNLPDMPIRWGLFVPSNVQLNGASGGNGGLMLGTELGVWTTSVINGNSTVWIPNNQGLANVRTDMIKLRTTDNTVLAATHGRGLFTTILPTVVTGINPPVSTSNFIKYINAENNRLLIATGGLNTRTITTQLFNIAGQEIYNSKTAYQNTSINMGRFAKGVYTLRVTGNNGEVYLKKFINR